MRIANVNLKVLLMDTDYYALQAIDGYLAWDRRTRVVGLADSVDSMWTMLAGTPTPELPDVVVIDADHLGGATALKLQLQRLRERIRDVIIICLVQHADLELLETALDMGARGMFLKGDVRLHIAWAIVYALDHEFVITAGFDDADEELLHPRLKRAHLLPPRREFPALTERIRQAIELCVVKGMPAHLAADEMGISLHTVRSYIKEGYRILEAYDGTEYPQDMTPQERAFMRLTGIEDEDSQEGKKG